MFAGEINQRPFWANFSFDLSCDVAKLTVLIKMQAQEPLSNAILLTLSHPSRVRVQKVSAPNAHEPSKISSNNWTQQGSGLLADPAFQSELLFKPVLLIRNGAALQHL